MKHITKVLVSSFTAATTIAGTTAGTSIPILSNQSQTSIINQNSSEVPVSENVTSDGKENNSINSQPSNPVTDDSQDTSVVIPTKSYSAAEYKQFFDAANIEGIAKQTTDYNAAYLDLNDLSNDVNSSNYFANYYEPIIPEELSSNNIFAVPQSFQIKDKTVIFNYNLESNDKQISIPTNVTIHGFYQYPTFSNGKEIQPFNNLNFLKANLGSKPNRKTFDQFVINHWNDSLANDAINAIGYYYLLEKTKTSRLKKYIADNFHWPSLPSKDRRDDWNIAYLIGAPFSQSSAPWLLGELKSTVDWVLPHGADSVKIDPVYEFVSIYEGNKYWMVFKWSLPNFVQENYHDSASWRRRASAPFTIIGQIKISFEKTKPQMMTDFHQRSKLAKVKLSNIEVSVINPNLSDHDAWKIANWQDKNLIDKSSFDILEALYQYFISNGSVSPKNPTPYFDWFKQALNKSV